MTVSLTLMLQSRVGRLETELGRRDAKIREQDRLCEGQARRVMELETRLDACEQQRARSEGVSEELRALSSTLKECTARNRQVCASIEQL